MVSLDFAAVVSRIFALFANIVLLSSPSVKVTYNSCSSVTNSANRPCTHLLEAKFPSLIERPLVAEMFS